MQDSSVKVSEIWGMIILFWKNASLDRQRAKRTWQISGGHLWWFLQSGQSCSLAHWKCGRYVQYTWHPKLMLRGACGSPNMSKYTQTIPNIISFQQLKTFQGQSWANSHEYKHLHALTCFHCQAGGRRKDWRGLTCRICSGVAVGWCPGQWDRRSQYSKWDTGLSPQDQRRELQSL